MEFIDPLLSDQKIEIPDEFWRRAMCHPHMTRLHNIHQLGNLGHVYVACKHTRFAHSLGTAYRISKILPSHVEKCDRDKAVFAGICHDLGHGPFSHSLEHYILPALGIHTFKHEEFSVKFAKEIYDTIEEPTFEFSHFDDILHSGTGSGPNDVFQLVSSKTTGFDADRYDYLLRDSSYAGISLDVNFSRITNGIDFRPDTMGKKYCQVLQRSAVQELAKFLAARYFMFENLYQNPVTVGVELMVAQIFLEADPFSKFSQKIFEPEYFLEQNDSILWRFRKYRKKSSKLDELFSRLDRRDFYINCGWIDMGSPEYFASNREEKSKVCQKSCAEIVSVLAPKIPESDVFFVELDIDESKDVRLDKTYVQLSADNPDSLSVVTEDTKLTALFGHRKVARLQVFAKHAEHVDDVKSALSKWNKRHASAAV